MNEEVNHITSSILIQKKKIKARVKYTEKINQFR